MAGMSTREPFTTAKRLPGVRLLTALVLVLAAVIAGCGGASSGVPAPSSPAVAVPLPGAILVTRANDRGTVTAKVGDRIQIALGSDYEWRLDPPDGVILVRGVQDQALVKGTQAIWTAAAPGTGTISATGTVVCPSGQACILIAILFSTTVVVGAP
jgi:hypothetical protein